MSAEKKTFIDRFNKSTDEFLGELAQTFPNIQQFSHFRTAFNLLKTVTPDKPQTFFDTYIAIPYKEKILAKDETFFLKEQYDIESDSKDYWFSFIETIRNLWSTLSDDNKDIVWQYFKVLIVLNDKCLQ